MLHCRLHLRGNFGSRAYAVDSEAVVTTWCIGGEGKRDVQRRRQRIFNGQISHLLIQVSPSGTPRYAMTSKVSQSFRPEESSE